MPCAQLQVQKYFALHRIPQTQVTKFIESKVHILTKQSQLHESQVVLWIASQTAGVEKYAKTVYQGLARGGSQQPEACERLHSTFHVPRARVAHCD